MDVTIHLFIQQILIEYLLFTIMLECEDAVR